MTYLASLTFLTAFSSCQFSLPTVLWQNSLSGHILILDMAIFRLGLKENQDEYVQHLYYFQCRTLLCQNGGKYRIDTEMLVKLLSPYDTVTSKHRERDGWQMRKPKPSAEHYLKVRNLKLRAQTLKRHQFLMQQTRIWSLVYSFLYTCSQRGLSWGLN